MIERKVCRLCKGHLRSVLDLGEIYPSNFVGNTSDYAPEPLHLVRCARCGLVQLKHTTDQDTMYKQYWYQSGINPRMIQYLQEVIDGIEERIQLQPFDQVLDIGANDGTFLSLYKTEGITRVGVDPAKNLTGKAKENCDFFFNDYFRRGLLPPYYYKVITTIAMFYDLDDPHQFIEDVKCHLALNGIWVIQFTDLVSMLKLNELGNICNEHLVYYTLRDLVDLLFQHNLDVFDVEYSTVNGGSIRAYVCYCDTRRIHDRVVFALRDEENYLKEDDVYDFADRINSIKYELVSLLRRLNKKGKTVHVLGASTKGNTLLQYFGINNELINFAADINPDKFNKKTLGSNIIIIPEEKSLELNPDYYLVLPWHFKDFFIKAPQFVKYFENGGKFIFPMPTVHIYPEAEDD